MYLRVGISVHLNTSHNMNTLRVASHSLCKLVRFVSSPEGLSRGGSADKEQAITLTLSLSKVRIFAHFLKQRKTGEIWNI